ncbi:S-adenosyl-L-methionine-dependent methyltransferase, partial [Calocera viscosa TUFC12733]
MSANQDGSESKYSLTTDEPEAQRLNKQHVVLRKLFDNRLLHEGLELKDGDKVLESGAGTGVWALYLASEVPDTVQIECIDINPHLFPVSSPKNVHFSASNILTLPDHFDSKYTLIHQRFLSGAFGNKDWKTCIKNMYAALRPGGWLHLEELYGRIVPELPHSAKLMQISLVLERARDIDFAAVEKIPVWLKEAGFENVQVFIKPWKVGPGDEFRDKRDLLLGAWRAIRVGTKKSGYDMGMSDEEWEQFVRDLNQELQDNE